MWWAWDYLISYLLKIIKLDILKSEKIILEVTLLSKWKTAIQLIAISNCLIYITLKHLENNLPILDFIFEISWYLSYLIIPAALLSLLTGFKYLKIVSSLHIKENSWN